FREPQTHVQPSPRRGHRSELPGAHERRVPSPALYGHVVTQVLDQRAQPVEERPHGHLRTGELLVDERLDAGPLPAGGFGGGLGYVPARVDLGAVLVLEPATYRL